VRDGHAGPRSFLHWYWRVLGLFGLSSTWLATGNSPNARRDADLFLQAALSCADQSLQALAWAVKAQMVQAERSWPDATDCIEKALAAADDFEAPIFAWRVHLIAAEFYQGTRDSKAAEQHRPCAEALILGLANSFEEGEALRESLLSAVPFRRILGGLGNSKTAVRPRLVRLTQPTPFESGSTPTRANVGIKAL
jgi:hypothetical protein